MGSIPTPGSLHAGFRSAQNFADAGDEHIKCSVVLAAFRENQVGKTFARLNEKLVTRPNGRQILSNHAVVRASSIGDVALESSREANIGGRVDENSQVE